MKIGKSQLKHKRWRMFRYSQARPHTWKLPSPEEERKHNMRRVFQFPVHNSVIIWVQMMWRSMELNRTNNQVLECKMLQNFSSSDRSLGRVAVLQVQVLEIVWEFSIFLPDLKERKGDCQTWERTFKSKSVIKSLGIPGTLSFYNLAAGCPDFFHA